MSRVVWYRNSKGQTDNLAIQTHTEAIQLWRTEDVSAHSVLTRDNVCHGVRRTVSEYTYIGGLWPAQEQVFIAVSYTHLTLPTILLV